MLTNNGRNKMGWEQRFVHCSLYIIPARSPWLHERQRVEDLRRLVDHERDLLEVARGHRVDEGLDADRDLANRFGHVLLHHTEHDTGADRGETDGLVARLVRRAEGRADDRAERTLEIVDDEHDITELAAVLTALLGNHSLCVNQR